MADPKPDDDNVGKVRDKLNKERVKLWQPPYTLEDGTKGELPPDMLERYSADLQLSIKEVGDILEQLRKHSLEKLAARRRLSETGVTTLTIKVAGKLKVEKAEFPVEIGLQVLGSELKQQVSTCSGIPFDRLKLIGCGRVIVNEQTLFEQHVRPDSQIMAMVLTESEAAAKAQDEEQQRLKEARQDAELISQSSGEDRDDFYVQIADQSGNPLNLPVKERKALALAMTLHERGKAAMRRKEYAYALLLLLDADDEFSKCSASILNSVDNFALLCLDISWCYLCLQSVNHLPDAETRLLRCEQCLYKSYGDNLERLHAIKGGASNELALLMRLHLLQGIVAYHRRQYDLASRLLDTAEKELNDLHVDDEKLSYIMSLGYCATEARLALRNCSGNVEVAVSQIIQRREEREERIIKEAVERKKRKSARKLGKTINGELVNVDSYKTLLSMGFSRQAAKEALIRANNIIGLAVQLLQENPEISTLQAASSTSDIEITDLQVTQVAALGFDIASTRRALEQSKGNIQAALDLLLHPESLTDNMMVSDRSSSSSSDEAAAAKTPEDLAEAFKRIRAEVPEDEEAHLDLTLEEEMQFLQEYKVKLLQQLDAPGCSRVAH